MGTNLITRPPSDRNTAWLHQVRPGQQDAQRRMRSHVARRRFDWKIGNLKAKKDFRGGVSNGHEIRQAARSDVAFLSARENRCHGGDLGPARSYGAAEAQSAIRQSPPDAAGACAESRRSDLAAVSRRWLTHARAR